MQDVVEIIMEIEAIFMNPKREDGRNLYQILSKSEMSLGDESHNYNLILEEWAKDEPSYDRFEEISSRAIDYAIVEFKNLNWSCIRNDGLMLVYVSDRNDLFYIQISDNHAHMHLHQSGQY